MNRLMSPFSSFLIGRFQPSSPLRDHITTNVLVVKMFGKVFLLVVSTANSPSTPRVG